MGLLKEERYEIVQGLQHAEELLKSTESAEEMWTVAFRCGQAYEAIIALKNSIQENAGIIPASTVSAEVGQ